MSITRKADNSYKWMDVDDQRIKKACSVVNVWQYKKNMKIFLTLTLFSLLQSAIAVFQCYQCTHTEIDQDIDCLNADVKYLQNCTDDNQTNAAEEFGPTVQQITDWSCQMRSNQTFSVLVEFVRECIPRLYSSGCSSYGNINVTLIECYCDDDGCNYLTPNFETTTTSTTAMKTTTLSTTTTDNGNGSSNLELHSVLTVSSILTYCLVYGFSIYF
ncbi:hypothetical protein HA402_014053 [Bradysia odoriphaga]|nr:hypothetical protein HA402_014053 [Bradysia odoriphaga]